MLRLANRFCSVSGPSTTCCSVLLTHELLARNYARIDSQRNNSTSSTTNSASSSKSFKPKSIFSEESAWDHVFKDINNMPPLLPSTLRNPLRSQGQRRTRRQQMTARELSAFDDMFTMIFDAVSEKKARDSDSKSDVDIGKGGDFGDLFGKLRRHSKRMKWSTEEDEMLDRKKEQMDLCDTDQQLLDWAMREVFAESEQYEKASREALENGTTDTIMLQSPTYPHVIALLMQTFRDKYHDPNLAVFIFDHARHLSIASYVFGCSTMAYNELLKTKWTCFRDLKGVHDALQEMTVNGVDIDNGTRKVVEQVRREVGERNVWLEEDSLGNGEMWSMLAKIEGFVAKPDVHSSASAENRRWDDWKTSSKKDEDDDWGFDEWDRFPSERKDTRLDR